jgi:hypothetical protein
VAFLDDDDIWLPGKLEVQVSVLDREPAVGLVCSNARVTDESGREIGPLMLRPDQGVSGDVLAELLGVNFVVDSSVVARRSLIERAGGFTELKHMRGVDDYDLWLRIAANTRIVYLPESLVYYREHGGSMRIGVPRSRHWSGVLEAVENVGRFLDVDDVRKSKLVKPRRAEYLVRLALAQRSELGARTAGRSLAAALKADPAAALSTLLWEPVDGRLRAARSALGRLLRRAGVRSS